MRIENTTQWENRDDRLRERLVEAFTNNPERIKTVLEFLEQRRAQILELTKDGNHPFLYCGTTTPELRMRKLRDEGMRFQDLFMTLLGYLRRWGGEAHKKLFAVNSFAGYAATAIATAEYYVTQLTQAP